MFNALPLSNSKFVVAALFIVALAVFFSVFGEQYHHAWVAPDNLIAPIMSLGSFVAGSTFLGGGAVAFPGLTKVLGASADTAKTFSLAIQSIGMTSASLYILIRVRNLPIAFFSFFIPSTVLGLLLSLGFLDTLIVGNDLRIGFTLFLFVFMLVYLWAFSNKKDHYTDLGVLSLIDKNLIVKAGFLGGILSGLLGSGADLVAFCLLAFYFRLELKLATQISVVIMAITSVFGTLFQWLVFNDITPQIKQLWLLAAPVVMIGAPLGAMFCRRVTNRFLIVFIGVIVSIEVVSTVILIPFEFQRSGYYISLVVLSISLLVLLHKISKRKKHTDQHLC
ncbi:TSUP family transporter [Teredinibacter purpureus]|uniref:TSUP family transporter n=1 Tax=Teredinibacter purpureus TaxID=2731756 RepID=UPI0005F7F04D|nr:TSUP family transporter [Teredinibacter purpureus]